MKILFQTEFGIKILQLIESIQDNREWDKILSDSSCCHRFSHVSGFYIDISTFSIRARFRNGYEPKFSIVDKLSILTRLKRFVKEYKEQQDEEIMVSAINDINLHLYKRMKSKNE